jgi:hypothetical protein
MSKTLAAAQRNLARLDAALAKRVERAAQAAVREAARLAKAEEALQKATLRVERVRQQAADRAAKRADDAEGTQQRLEQARNRVEALRQQEQERAARPKPSAGTLTTATGESRLVSREAIVVVRKALGRRRHGLLAPLDGSDAQAVLTALESGGHAGDSFTLAVKGRKGLLRFTVVADGLSFETVTTARLAA